MQNFAVLLPTYIVWHYTAGLRDLDRVSTNLLWFIFHFFSIGVLLRTLFSPWKRLAKDESVHHPTFLSNLIINILMRFVGAGLRGLTVLIGLLFFLAGTVLFFFVLCVWVALPILVPILFLYGISFFIL